jgi:hypothetical protein
MAYETVAAANNAEGGIIFSVWADAIIHNRNSASTSTNLTYIDNTNYNNVSTGIGQNTWANITACFIAGYAASGTTTGIFLKNGINYKNFTTVPRNDIGGIGLHNRLPSSGIMYIGLLRLWNYTKYGTSAPQAAAASSCTYGGSGNWVINLADTCNISTTVTVYPNNVTVNGTGKLYVNSGGNIYAKGFFFIPPLTGTNIISILSGGKISVGP